MIINVNLTSNMMSMIELAGWLLPKKMIELASWQGLLAKTKENSWFIDNYYLIRMHESEVEAFLKYWWIRGFSRRMPACEWDPSSEKATPCTRSNREKNENLRLKAKLKQSSQRNKWIIFFGWKRVWNHWRRKSSNSLCVLKC